MLQPARPCAAALRRGCYAGRRLRGSLCAAEASGESPTSDDRLASLDFRRLQRLEQETGEQAAAVRGATEQPSPAPLGLAARIAQAASVRRRNSEAAGQTSGTSDVELHSSRSGSRVPWRSRHSAMPLGVVETQERLAWLLQLTLASKRHDAEHARALLAEMSDSGCQPGAREYHLAVVACGLHGDVAGMLEIMREQHGRGGRALLETYKAVIRASARARDPELAAEAQKGAAAPLLSTCACLINAAASSRAAAATLAGYADYESWRTLCNSLFVARATEEAFEAVHKGKARGHLPGPDTALHMLRFCGEKARQPEATMLWQQFQTEGLQLSNEHYNAFMESMIYTFGMRQTLQMQIVGTALPGMDTAGVNMVLDAMTRHPSQLGDTGESWNPSMLLRQLEANLAEQGCQPDALTHVLALEVACKMGEMDLAMHHFRRLEEHADVVQLSEERVSALLRGLSGVGRGEDLLEVLCTLRDEQLPLPSIGLDSHGQSLATSWLAAERAVPRDLGLMYLRHEREERSSRLAAERDVRGWRGPRLVMPPLSKMRVHELRAEAVSLGLDSDGGRKDVYDRIRNARQEVKEGVASPDLLAAAHALYEEEEDASPIEPRSRRGSQEMVAPLIPLIPTSPWRDSALQPADALALALELCDVLGEWGAMPTQGDVVAMARESAWAADPEAARRLLLSATAAPSGACVQLYILAAEAHVAAGDLHGAVRLVDDADLAGIVIPLAFVEKLLDGTGRMGTLGPSSLSAAFKLDIGSLQQTVHLL